MNDSRQLLSEQRNDSSRTFAPASFMRFLGSRIGKDHIGAVHLQSWIVSVWQFLNLRDTLAQGPVQSNDMS